MPDIAFAPSLNPAGSPNQPFSEFQVVNLPLSQPAQPAFMNWPTPAPFAPSSSGAAGANAFLGVSPDLQYIIPPTAGVGAGVLTMVGTGSPITGLLAGFAAAQSVAALQQYYNAPDPNSYGDLFGGSQ